MAANWWPMRLKSVMMEVLLPIKVADIFRPGVEIEEEEVETEIGEALVLQTKRNSM